MAEHDESDGFALWARREPPPRLALGKVCNDAMRAKTRFHVSVLPGCSTNYRSPLAPKPSSLNYNMPVSSRAASDIIVWFHGGSKTRATSASATVGIIS